MFECKPTAKFKLNAGFEVQVFKDKFINQKGKGQFDTKGLEESKDFVIDFELLTTEKPIKLPLILYDLGKFDLLPQYQDSLTGLIKTMTENPTIVIELRSHTDSRGSNKSNEVLSFNRSKSVVDFLISKGIAGDRMVPKGMGEYELLNGCKDGVKCTEDEHQINRRTDFKVIRNDYVAPKDPSKIEAPKIIVEDEDGEEVEPTTPPADGTTPPAPPKN
jgi:outer membrane protein OmpA-like peptidoglycan-associated protein